MNKQLRRRMFLGSLIGGAIVAAGVGFTVLPLSPELRVKNLLRARLHYLKISDDVLEKFINDFKADPETRFDRFRTMKYAVQRVMYSQPFFTDQLNVFRFERYVISAFLMSTDFFREGANVERPVSYVAYNDPYKVGCANHFARL